MGNAAQKLNDPVVQQAVHGLGDIAKQKFGPQVKNIEDNIDKIRDVGNLVHR